MFKKIVILLLTTISQLVSILCVPVFADSQTTCQVSYFENSMILDCLPGYVSGHDRISIFSKSVINENLDWLENLDYKSSVWLFDIEADNQIDLILKFSTSELGLIAELYDDRNADGIVGYEIVNDEIDITENDHWTVKVVAPDGWWLRDDVPNYNLNIWVDGDVEGMFMMEAYREFLVTDGDPDYEIQIYDLNYNGKPEFDRRRILTPFLKDATGLQTQIMINFADNELPISGEFDLWPYLDLSHEWAGGSRVVKDYRFSSPPIIFEPSTGRIEAIGEFVASRGNDRNCFYYSALPWEKDQINQTDFESPFCFYDLANDNDRVPELQVRALYFPSDDKYLPGGTLPNPVNWIRYSWDQDNSQTWKYAVGLLGRNEFETPVIFADYEVLSVPYEDFPAWVTDQEWDMAVFSEFTGRQYFTSEGMYNVSYLESSNNTGYIAGYSSVAPDLSYKPEVGFRMEWSIDHGNQPYLYFSPFDRRLHLLGADGGTWQISESEAIHYQNLGSGEMINQWTYSLHGQVKKMMFTYSDLSVYFEDGNLSIWSSTSQNPMFTTLPPTDHNTWLELGKKIDQNLPEFEPDDFTAMLEQFGSMKAEIEGGTIQDLRITEDGFRFILNLDKAFKVLKADLIGARGLKPGLYLVTYEDEFYIQPFTPVNLEINLGEKAERFYTKLKSSIPVVLQNNGIEDAHNVTVSSIIQSPDGILSWSQEKVIDVLAGEEKIIQIPFSPEIPGNWEITVTATRFYDYVPYWKDQFNQELSITVYPALDTTLLQDLTAFGVIQPWQLIAMFSILFLIVLLSAWLLSHQLWIRTIHAPASSHPDEQL